MKKFEIKNFYSKTNLGNKYGYGDQLVDDQHICIKSKWDSEKAGFCNLADNGAPVSGTKLRFFHSTTTYLGPIRDQRTTKSKSFGPRFRESFCSGDRNPVLD